MLTIKNISKSYGKNSKKFTCLNNISLSFNEPSLNLIVGKSGSGKTTLSNIIGGLDSPSVGKIIFNGTEITKKNVDSYRNSNVGFVFQQLNLIETFTMKENIKLAYDLSCQKMTEESVIDVLNKVSLPDNISIEDFLSRYPNQLSVGQQQRAAIAIALVKNPTILILDEPTSALDDDNATILVSLLHEISKKIIVIITTHDKELFFDSADQVIEIKDKKINIIKENQLQGLKDKQIKLKKGFFSFNETLKIALFNLKNKKVKLLTSMLLSIFTATIFGIAFLAQTCNVTDVRLRTQIDAGIKDALIINTYKYSDNTNNNPHQELIEFSEQQSEYIKKYTGGKCAPYHKYISPINRSIYSLNTDNSFLSIYINFTQYVEVNPLTGINDLSLTRYSILNSETECRLTLTYDEIAISDLGAEFLKYNGILESVEYLDNGERIEHIKYIDKVDDLIGFKLPTGLTITGIYSTSDKALDFWKPYFGMSSAEIQNLSNNEHIYSARSGFSLAQCMFAMEGFSNSETQSKYNSKVSQYHVSLTGNYNKDRNFLNSFKFKDDDGNSQYVELKNWYSSYTSLIDTFETYSYYIWWIIISLAIVSVILTLNFFYSNIKTMEKDLGIFKAMGASKLATIFIILLQSLIISVVEVIISLIALQIISIIINKNVSISLMAINISTIGLLLLILVASALLISLISSRKAVLQKPINVIQHL